MTRSVVHDVEDSGDPAAALNTLVRLQTASVANANPVDVARDVASAHGQPLSVADVEAACRIPKPQVIDPLTWAINVPAMGVGAVATGGLSLAGFVAGSSLGVVALIADAASRYGARSDVDVANAICSEAIRRFHDEHDPVFREASTSDVMQQVLGFDFDPDTPVMLRDVPPETREALERLDRGETLTPDEQASLRESRWAHNGELLDAWHAQTRALVDEVRTLRDAETRRLRIASQREASRELANRIRTSIAIGSILISELFGDEHGQDFARAASVTFEVYKVIEAYQLSKAIGQTMSAAALGFGVAGAAVAIYGLLATQSDPAQQRHQQIMKALRAIGEQIRELRQELREGFARLERAQFQTMRMLSELIEAYQSDQRYQSAQLDSIQATLRQLVDAETRESRRRYDNDLELHRKQLNGLLELDAMSSSDVSDYRDHLTYFNHHGITIAASDEYSGASFELTDEGLATAILGRGSLWDVFALLGPLARSAGHPPPGTLRISNPAQWARGTYLFVAAALSSPTVAAPHRERLTEQLMREGRATRAYIASVSSPETVRAAATAYRSELTALARVIRSAYDTYAAAKNVVDHFHHGHYLKLTYWNPPGDARNDFTLYKDWNDWRAMAWTDAHLTVRTRWAGRWDVIERAVELGVVELEVLWSEPSTFVGAIQGVRIRFLEGPLKGFEHKCVRGQDGDGFDANKTWAYWLDEWHEGSTPIRQNWKQALEQFMSAREMDSADYFSQLIALKRASNVDNDILRMYDNEAERGFDGLQFPEVVYDLLNRRDARLRAGFVEHLGGVLLAQHRELIAKVEQRGLAAHLLRKCNRLARASTYGHDDTALSWDNELITLGDVLTAVAAMIGAIAPSFVQYQAATVSGESVWNFYTVFERTNLVMPASFGLPYPLGGSWYEEGLKNQGRERLDAPPLEGQASVTLIEDAMAALTTFANLYDLDVG